ncbi:MAG TPA: hypothetical protein VFJ58_16270 [Armatimonadota bacterium]|nr:hypothetical protein [Armatimonadota bacterium]
MGHVLRFHVEAEYLERFSPQTVGASWCREYWIPASELQEFNRHIVGPIELIATFSPE